MRQNTRWYPLRSVSQAVQLGSNAVPLGLQAGQHLAKARRLAGADLQFILRQQKIFRSILNCAVRCCVDLVQQVIQVLLTHHAELCLTLAIRSYALYFVQLRIAKVKHSSA